VLGAYTIVRLLGAGGMGAVYEAVHRALDKRVALKTLHPEYARVPELAERFLREGRAASRLRHPNVVDVTDVGEANGITYLVMAYLEGESLAALARREAPIALERVVELLLPVLSAIATAHEEGVIHRDLKPENVVLARDRLGRVEPKVLDFGISKLARADALTRTAAHMGTPHYMAPELAQGAREASPASDQWALGAIAFRLLTGRLLADHDNAFAVVHAIASGRYPKLREVRPELPPAFAGTIDRSLALQPERRFVGVIAFGAALLPFATDGVRARWAPSFARDDAPTAIPSADIASSPQTRADVAVVRPSVDPASAGTPPRVASVGDPANPRPSEARALADARAGIEPSWGTDVELDAGLAPHARSHRVRLALAATLGVAALGLLAALALRPGHVEVEALGAPGGESPVALDAVAAPSSAGAATTPAPSEGAAATPAPRPAPSGPAATRPRAERTSAPPAATPTAGRGAMGPATDAPRAPTPPRATDDATPSTRPGAALDGPRAQPALPPIGATFAGGGTRTTTPSAVRPTSTPRPLPTRGNPGRRVILAP
jgi:serine/threonine-protein kinase